jgi:HK97 family phage portal protein
VPIWEQATNRSDSGQWPSANSSPGSGESGLVKLETEQRSLENPTTPITEIHSWDDWSGERLLAHAGVKIDPESALTFSAVYSAINIIAETLATLPIGFYKKVENGKELAIDHPIFGLFAGEPNEYMTWFTFMHCLVSATLRYGNGYASIIRNGAGRPIKLHFLEQGDCSPVYMKVGGVRYLYYYVDGVMVEKRDVIHLLCMGNNGVIGKSPITLHAEGIGMAKAAEVFGARFYGNGTNPAGAFVKEGGSLSDTAFKRLDKQLREKYQGLHKSHEIMLLEEGLKWTPFSINPKDAEYIVTRKFQIEEIARIYRVPLHKLQSLERSTNNNIEQQTVDFKTDCVVPWTERIEQEFKRKLILPYEKVDHFFNMNVDYLLRGDPVSRSTYQTNRFATASITPNQIREMENENRMNNPLMDLTYAQTSLQPLREENWKPNEKPAAVSTPQNQPAE